MKKIGLIGGVSWESTLLYYQLINQAVRHQLGGLNSAPLLINSLNYAPIVQWEREDNWAAVTEHLIAAAKTLEKAGADFLLLACNTLHKVAPELEKALSLPFLHIADAAGEKCQQAQLKKIGLLGTQFTMEEGFYSERLKNKFGLEVITPVRNEREALDKIIYQELCQGLINSQSKDLIRKSIQSLLETGAEGILLACTELGLIMKPEEATVLLLDTTVLHVQKALSLAW